ncbi:beta-class carbonic anhydrase [Haloquadratum walsbyi]|jgi:Carbonic anhydrase|uniref:Carbonic anhydrase n=2 Tax=Haloquadratum walsbyi TaxID=293091 RepID=Q18IJ9_HALWD|nr:carbonic anhydrase [Haloquadratum walsbyi]CAJ52173.1 carbonic anhydrase [Haloquadratum walsbyi DSM 16790]CCC40101.1 carbonic anhydrase [Haloquadratum walsbyi C23]
MMSNTEHVHEQVDESVENREMWARRRREGIPTNENLLVITCIDERIPVEETLGIELGDAQIFRNAGGKVTDDVIRSAALTTNFFDTDEIILINHTDCGMMSAPDEAVREGFEAEAGDLDQIDLDPSLPALNIDDADIMDWVKMTDDIDEACATQVEHLRQSELIPDSVTITGYVYEVESGELRRPGDRVGEIISERQ